MQLSGTSINTTALAPISTLLPIRIGPNFAPDPISTLSPTIGAHSSSTCRRPTTTRCEYGSYAELRVTANYITTQMIDDKVATDVYLAGQFNSGDNLCDLPPIKVLPLGR